jgi:hypothetical protein
MHAPVAVAHAHVHSIRLASGEEALAARVLTPEGIAGFGFSLKMDATAARQMAGWDALARSRGLTLAELVDREGLGREFADRHGADWRDARSALEPQFATLRWIP